MQKSPIRIEVYSHFFKVFPERFQIYLIDSYVKRYIHWSMYKKQGQWIREIKAIYAGFLKNKSEYRFHINDLPSFFTYLKSIGFTDETILVKEYSPDDLEWDSVDIDISPNLHELRETQKQAIDFCLDYKDRNRQKLVELITGEGKSLVSINAAVKSRSRIVMVVRAQYLDKWKSDLLESLQITPDEIAVISGSDSLKDILQAGIDKKLDKIKAIIISNRTFLNWVSLYEEVGYEGIKAAGYPCHIEEYCNVLGAKVLLVDEGHQDFHFNFRLMFYTHCKVVVTTTATINPDDPFLKKMVRIIFPNEAKFNPGTKKSYVDCINYHYHFKAPKYIRYKSFMGYSHVEFEKSVMRHVPTRESYFGMVFKIIKDYYIPVREKKYKAIVFCSTIKMCTLLTEYLQRRLKGVDIRRYVGEDPYENLIEPEVIISTPGSSGTAVNVPNLYLNINTVAISTSGLSQQILGRLREMRDGTNLKFVQLVCNDIPKHLDYIRNKEKIYDNKARSFSDEYYGFNI